MATPGETAPGIDGSLGAFGALGFGISTAVVLATQLVLSRFLAATLSATFAFVLVSLAMLGLACGALVVHFLGRSPAAGRRAAALWGTLAGGSLHVGMLEALSFYAGASPDPSAARTFGSLAWVFLGLFPFFLFSGVLVATVLARSGTSFHRAYAVDLVGAAAGCGLGLALLASGSPSSAVLTSLAPLACLGGALLAFSPGRRNAGAAGAALAALVLFLAGTELVRRPSVRNPPHVAILGRPRLDTLWNTFSSLTIHPARFLSWALSPRYAGPSFRMDSILIDGIGATQVVEFDGNPASLGRYEYLGADLTALAHELLPREARQLIIGPGGGVDVLQAYRAGKRDLTLVEINPLMVEAVNGTAGAFSGRPYFLPGVRLFVENGRTFVRRTQEKWDLVSLTWVDTGGQVAALSASENYLYTVEAYGEFLSRLAPDGYLAFLRALGLDGSDIPMDTLRGLSVTLEALAARGAAHPSRQVLVAAVESPFFLGRGMCYVLVKNGEFTAEETAKSRDFLKRWDFHALWMPDGSARVEDLPAPWRERGRLIQELLTTPDRKKLYREAAIDLQPATDDNPFYFVERGGPNRRAGQGLRLLASCCLFLLALVVVFLLLPLLPSARLMPPVTLPAKGFLLYCALAGVAFMLVEMEFFHAFSLVLGSPSWSLGVVLSSLLVFSGIGSLSAARFANARTGLALAFGGLAIALGAFLLAREPILRSIVGLSFPARIAAVTLLVAPIGFLMGIPMAAGMTVVGDRPLLRMWGWSINGACSVLASVGAVLFAIHAGISATFAAGLACYVTAGFVLHAVRRRREALPAEA